MLALRDYQSSCVDDLRAVYAAGSVAPLLVLPTGGGKTVVFTYMATRAAEKGKRVLLLGHRRELIGQMSAALKRWNCPHGVITPDAKINNSPVQVGMVQTIANRINLDKQGRYKFDLVIIDEAHHATKNSTWGRVLQHNAGAKLLGVSATPCRLDGKGLGMHADGFFDRMVIGPTMPELIEMGNLVRPVVYAPAQSIDLSGVKKSRGDFAIGALAGAVDRAPITGNAIAEYQKFADRRSAIAFTVTVEHAGHVVEQFKASGYQAAVLTGSTPDKERAQMIRDLGNGSLHVLASCNVVSEGTDIPSVFAAILLRPTESYALAMQQIGRALRPSAGKDRAIILDHADNVRRHGLPTDAVEWSLDGLRKKKGKSKAAPTKVCIGCRAYLPLSARVCPECGFEVKGGASRSELNEVDGELVEMSPEMIAARRKQKGNEFYAAKTLNQLIAFGIKHNYKKPKYWAQKIINERQLAESKVNAKSPAARKSFYDAETHEQLEVYVSTIGFTKDQYQDPEFWAKGFLNKQEGIKKVIFDEEWIFINKTYNPDVVANIRCKGDRIRTWHKPGLFVVVEWLYADEPTLYMFKGNDSVFQGIEKHTKLLETA